MTIERDDPAMRPTRVLLLRHAETAVPDHFHGAESDVGLGTEGHRQALAVADHLAAMRPDAVYCSGMRRARETAAPIAAACEIEPTVVTALHERRMGPMSNVPIAQVRAVVDRSILRWGEGDLDASHEGGESYRSLRDRVVPPFVALAEQHRVGTIVVVVHGVVIRVLISALIDDFTPADYHRIAIRHVAVNDLRFANQIWTVSRLDQDAEALRIDQEE